jgi:hypothetical protein
VTPSRPRRRGRAQNDNTERRVESASEPLRTKTSWLSRVGFVIVGARRSVTGQGVWPVVVRWFQGLGSDCAEEPVFRCEPVTLATESFLECPARAR